MNVGNGGVEKPDEGSKVDCGCWTPECVWKSCVGDVMSKSVDVGNGCAKVDGSVRWIDEAW